MRPMCQYAATSPSCLSSAMRSRKPVTMAGKAAAPPSARQPKLNVQSSGRPSASAAASQTPAAAQRPNGRWTRGGWTGCPRTRSLFMLDQLERDRDEDHEGRHGRERVDDHHGRRQLLAAQVEREEEEASQRREDEDPERNEAQPREARRLERQ